MGIFFLSFRRFGTARFWWNWMNLILCIPQISNVSILPEKRCKLRNVYCLPNNWEWMMFHSSIVTIVRFYTQNYYNSKYFVKSTTILAWIWQITQKGWFFALIFDNFTKAHFLHELVSWLSAHLRRICWVVCRAIVNITTKKG